MCRTLYFCSLLRMVPLNVSFSALPGWRRSAGLLFLRGKSRQKRAGETPAPLFLSNRTVSCLDGALPLNEKVLRVSNLCRVSHPTSPDGLLKGQMNQKGIFPPARSPRGIAAVAYATNMPPACLLYAVGPSGEVNSPPDQLRGASRNAASQWLRRAFLLASDWAKAGVQPKGGWRFFGSLLCVQK